MKLTKLIKNTVTLTLIGTSAMGVYAVIKTKELLIDMTEIIGELREKASELSFNINLFYGQIGKNTQ
jgi:predicted MarR family transcription regulator